VLLLRARLLLSCKQVPVKEVPTKPIDGQKTGTSGLRKKTKEFMSNNYLANWVQSLFNALGDEVAGQTLALGGDGRCEQQGSKATGLLNRGLQLLRGAEATRQCSKEGNLQVVLGVHAMGCQGT
jgi:hypothetical protein